jgi:hypothetical protein
VIELWTEEIARQRVQALRAEAERERLGRTVGNGWRSTSVFGGLLAIAKRACYARVDEALNLLASWGTTRDRQTAGQLHDKR